MERFNLALMQLALSAILLGPGAASAQQQVLIYGDANYPPYSFAEKGEPRGIYVDVLRAVFAKMTGYHVTIKMTPWKRGLKYVENGEGAALFPPYLVVERTPWMMLSDPILSEQVVVFGTEETLRGKKAWPEDFFGYKMGLNSGYDPAAMGGADFAAACASGKIKLLESYTTESNLSKLEAGRIQYYLNVGSTAVTPYPMVKPGPVVNVTDGYLGFTRKQERFPYLADFQKEFNGLVRQMRASKEIDAIVEAYRK